MEPHRSGAWQASVLSSLLRSPYLCGWLPEARMSVLPSRDPETGEPSVVGEALISPGDRRRLLDALAERSKVKAGRRVSAGPRPKAFLSKLAVCGSCGTGMVMTHNGNSYACSLTMSGGDCAGVTVSLQAADAYVTNAMLRRLAAMDPEVPEDLAVLEAVARALHGEAPEDARTRAERAALQAGLEDAEVRLDDLVTQRDAPEFRGDPGRQRYEQRDRLLGRVESAEHTIRELPAALPSIAPLLTPPVPVAPGAGR